MSNIDGIYNGSPLNPNSKVIERVEQGNALNDYIETTKSSFGRGGMLTKSNIARKVADEGIDVIIANGRRDNILTDLMNRKSETLHTHFVASSTSTSSVKKWIAHCDGFAKGELHLNDIATRIVTSDNPISILPIGIVKVEGNFEKDDLVKIIAFNGEPIGVGKVACDAAQVLLEMGQHDKKPIVHYDYLYIE